MTTEPRFPHRALLRGTPAAALIAGALLVGPAPMAAENAPAAEAAPSAEAAPPMAPVEPDATYAPSPARPFGRMHPDAPSESAQFAFMIGAFDCIDQIHRPDGSTLRFPAIWNARWFLNGHGIQDEYWSPRFATSNIRIFDAATGQWQVTFFRMPGYQSGVWQGRKEGDRMVMRQAGATTGPGLTFYNIRPDGFDWHSGGDQPVWSSSCTRRR